MNRVNLKKKKKKKRFLQHLHDMLKLIKFSFMHRSKEIMKFLIFFHFCVKYYFPNMVTSGCKKTKMVMPKCKSQGFKGYVWVSEITTDSNPLEKRTKKKR